jgi:DNA ligase-1
MLERGEEGTIIKNFDHVWEDKRSKGLVKMKAEKDCDLEVIGFNPGKGKNLGLIGSIICTSADNKVEVSISGLTDALRKEITDNQADWIGRIVEVKYNERISSRTRTDVDSLFLPRFVELREDKDAANNSAEIL